MLGWDTLESIVSKYICQKLPPYDTVTTYLFGYEVDNPSAEYLRYRIFDEPFSKSVEETYYTKNLKFAKEFFVDNVKALYESEGMTGINSLYRKLTLQLMFNIHEIDDDYDVFVAFETMNNRGKKLTNLELLKNRLIYLTTLYDDDKCDQKNKDGIRSKINEAWKEVYFQLGRNELMPLSDDEFLRAHWIIYFSYSRTKGDDYINFLLKKFSAKNIFEKVTVQREDAVAYSDTNTSFEDETETTEEVVVSTKSRLEPDEILNYVNSLKDIAKYWYDSYFPYESHVLTDEEKLWIDRLNRIGIGYYRPLVTAVLYRSDISVKDKVAVFKAVERYIFVCFRLAGYQSTNGSSEYYRAAKDIHSGEKKVEDLIKEINTYVDQNIQYAIPNFITKIEKYFDQETGYYDWGSKYYFMFEYEYSLFEKYGVKRIISWDMFCKSDKVKVSIEHILPQTPTKYYWKNQFRQFSVKEITRLSGALGNILPLSQSVNSALQNDSFEDKKHSKADGRRGYENGSNSEIEVAKEADWDADRIYKRSKKLIAFMSERWNIPIAEEDIERLIALPFIDDDREIPPELTKDEKFDAPAVAKGVSETDRHAVRIAYWEYALPVIQDAHGPQKSFSGVHSCDSNWISGFFGLGGFSLNCVANYDEARVELYLGKNTPSENKASYDALFQRREEIETKLGAKLEWRRLDDKKASIICFSLKNVSINNNENWPAMAKFHAEWTKKYYDVLVPILRNE